MARKKLPENVRRLHGTKDRESRAKTKRVFEPGIPQRPKWITGAARREWDRIVPILVEAGVVSEVDGPLLASWCSTVATLEEATREIRARGLFTESAREGALVRNPALAVQRDSVASLRALAGQLGIIPSRRSPGRSSGPEVAEGDGWLREFIPDGDA